MSNPLLSGSERLFDHQGELSDLAVLDFWRWAFSDFRDNTLRGVFAEWLVAQLLGIELGSRIGWASFDLLASGRVKIEVKTSAYLQAWEQKQPSIITFGNLRTRTWSPETDFAETPTYNADLYVFCVQIEQSAECWDALNLGQWRFYLLTRSQIMTLDQKTVGIATLERYTSALTAREFAVKGRAAVEAIAASDTSA
jgi:hypothetical protein